MEMAAYRKVSPPFFMLSFDRYIKGASENPHFIPTAVLRKNFLLAYLTYAARRNFFRALHLGEL
jgi:hypothetical protein